MTSNIGQIKNTQILVKPSDKLLEFIKNIKNLSDDIPVGIQNVIFKNKPKDKPLPKLPKLEYLTTEQDKEFITALNLNEERTDKDKAGPKTKKKQPDMSTKLLSLYDLHWLYEHLQLQNKNNDTKIYLHELMEGSQIILPKNEEIPRNEELEKRCQKLKAEQQNREYADMTKNVESVRNKLPEDSIAYQMKMMNSHLIAVFQFIVSVITGFAFGFIGIELLIGNIDFALRLMLGISCALIVAIAELYFLAKKLNEDLEFESSVKQKKPVGEKKVK